MQTQKATSLKYHLDIYKHSNQRIWKWKCSCFINSIYFVLLFSCSISLQVTVITIHTHIHLFSHILFFLSSSSSRIPVIINFSVVDFCKIVIIARKYTSRDFSILRVLFSSSTIYHFVESLFFSFCGYSKRNKKECMVKWFWKKP